VRGKIWADVDICILWTLAGKLIGIDRPLMDVTSWDV